MGEVGSPIAFCWHGLNFGHLMGLIEQNPNGRNQRPPAELGVWGWPLEGARATSAGGR
jgi:hypothetical protein